MLGGKETAFNCLGHMNVTASTNLHVTNDLSS